MLRYLTWKLQWKRIDIIQRILGNFDQNHVLWCMEKDPSEHIKDHLWYGLSIYHRIYIIDDEQFVQNNILLVSSWTLLFLNSYFLHCALSVHNNLIYCTVPLVCKSFCFFLWKDHWMWWSNPKVSFCVQLAKRIGIV